MAESHRTLRAFVTITTVSLHFLAPFNVLRILGVSSFDVSLSNSCFIACDNPHFATVSKFLSPFPASFSSVE